MRQSFLKMNDSKTEIVIFGTWNQCNKITTTAIDVDDTSVNISPQLTYLGVLLVQNLTLKAYILTKAKRVSYHLYRIRQIVKFLDLPAKQTLISSLVMSCYVSQNWPHTNFARMSKFTLKNQNRTGLDITMYQQLVNFHKCPFWFWGRVTNM